MNILIYFYLDYTEMIEFRFLFNKFLSLIYYNMAIVFFMIVILVLSHSYFKGGFFNAYLLQNLT